MTEFDIRDCHRKSTTCAISCSKVRLRARNRSLISKHSRAMSALGPRPEAQEEIDPKSEMTSAACKLIRPRSTYAGKQGFNYGNGIAEDSGT